MQLRCFLGGGIHRRYEHDTIEVNKTVRWGIRDQCVMVFMEVGCRLCGQLRVVCCHLIVGSATLNSRGSIGRREKPHEQFTRSRAEAAEGRTNWPVDKQCERLVGVGVVLVREVGRKAKGGNRVGTHCRTGYLSAEPIG